MIGFDGVAELGVLVGPGDREGEAGEEVVDDCEGLVDGCGKGYEQDCTCGYDSGFFEPAEF